MSARSPKRSRVTVNKYCSRYLRWLRAGTVFALGWHLRWMYPAPIRRYGSKVLVGVIRENSGEAMTDAAMQAWDDKAAGKYRGGHPMRHENKGRRSRNRVRRHR